LYDILKKQMVDALNGIGISLIEPTLGSAFDPNQQHAVHSHEFPEGAPEIDHVTQVHKVGLKMGSYVIVAAEVSVGAEKQNANENVTVAQKQQG
jgi:molecular chaperone GrpE (heat shock protein)